MGTKKKTMTKQLTEQELVKQYQNLNKWIDRVKRDLATVRGGGKVEIHYSEPERPDEMVLKGS